MNKTRVIIIGAGFGGIYTALKLSKLAKKQNIQITLLDKRNYFLFTPLLHEIATGSLGFNHADEAIRFLIDPSTTEYYQCSVNSINIKRKTVVTGEKEIPFDYLVIATGATTNFFGTKGAEEFSIQLKDLKDAEIMKQRIIKCFEEAVKTSDPEIRKKLLSFSIIGGGPTGVEVVAEIAEYCYDILKKKFGTQINQNEISVSLFEASDSILKVFKPSLQNYAKKVLTRKGVKVSLNSIVSEVKKDSIIIGGKEIVSGTTIWVAGVKPNTPTFDVQVLLDNQGKIIVTKYLNLESFPTIFALGDVAHQENKDGSLSPTVAQVAVNQAPVVAKNISAHLGGSPLSTFNYQSKGTLISLGRWGAVAQFGNIGLYGPLIWFLWRTIYLFKFISWRKRLKVMNDWFFDVFYQRDISLIEDE